MTSSQVSLNTKDVISCSMQAGGTMALLIARINMETISFVGSWRRYIMLR